MNNGFIAVLDSGIGGFSVLAEAAKIITNERFLYFGDNKNAPYGSKTKSELCSLTRKNLSCILKYDVKAIVVGCNTLSLNVMPQISPTLNVPVFGVYPPIFKKRGKTVLFATPLTCASLATEKNITVYPLKDLAADIENNKMNLAAVDIKTHIGERLFNLYFDTVILGCTHYYFVKNQFIDHFCPRRIVSGEKYTAKRLKKYLEFNDIMANNEQFTVDFIGENAEENFNFYNQVVKTAIFSS